MEATPLHNCSDFSAGRMRSFGGLGDELSIQFTDKKAFMFKTCCCLSQKTNDCDAVVVVVVGSDDVDGLQELKVEGEMPTLLGKII